MSKLKIIGVIPAHLGSIRFKRKILHNIYGLPMIEHVRRRALRSNVLDEVYVATGDEEILDTVSKFGGNIIKTFLKHSNGTSRVAESIRDYDCTHVVIIQGDEPLIQYEHIYRMSKSINEKPNIDAWNSTTEIKSQKDLLKVNVVKASINEDNRILYCFRKSPSNEIYENQIKYIKKIQGLIGFRKQSLLQICERKPTKCEIYESIEQLRIISYGYELYSVNQNNQVPSINEKDDLEEFYDYLKKNEKEYEITKGIINQSI